MKRKRKIKKAVKDFFLGIVFIGILSAVMYIGFDYAAYQGEKEYEIKMQKQAEWRFE